MSVLKRGGFLCKAVTDQNFPESYTDKSNKWMMIWQQAEKNPAGLSAQLLALPDNQAALQDAAGIDLEIPGKDARDRQLAEWELMQPKKGGDGPIPDEQATQKAADARQQQAQQVVDTVAPGTQAPPIPPQPEIQQSSVPTRVGDDHIAHARECVRILNSDDVWEMLSTDDAPVKDLILHLTEHLTKAQQGGIVIPPDLLGILPPPPLPSPGIVPPGGPGVAPGAAGAPGAPLPPKPAAAAPGAAPNALGGHNAALPA